MKDTNIKKFNAVYASHDCYYGLDLRKEFTDYFSDQPISGLKGIDLGCGEGRYSFFLAQKECHMISVDRSEAGIDKLKKTAEMHQLPISAEVMDIENFIFRKESADIIVAATILDHLDAGLRQKTVNGIKTALTPGGLLYVNVFTESDPGYHQQQHAENSVDLSNISDTAACMAYYFKAGELKSLFEDLKCLYYYEGVEPDDSHGRPHDHGWACLLAQKFQPVRLL